ncbi:MAG: UDP-N-acetylmuramate--L-alanine ligase [Bacteroidales bacterium]|nr:UDP-N-acetylmuramate--L-alanine ligase [Bacteroidales bacterium]MCF8344844.1 UDP-N-acetylmuramate--L-alanine ligase [Bacteroidales bacterium]MCF8352398.1 UDP-N-acetylmuramate--L-alanine ligase [Bacteroidales bacterium]MCF8377438.1 UDP-N-acetylmuramate--L-alanine ligase [Bacteroidales bacterium]MCF8401650.1 UDP-N-acetylmuramate--L-alanine ligase [Bacteroidales bacterium]
MNNLRNIYFLGIGGIGMSALARYFHARDVKVSGYDLNESDLTRKLQQEGIRVFYQTDENRIDEKIDLVIYTPAIPEDHPELLKALKLRLPVKKRSEVLGELTRRKKTIAVGGTHGKTTISSIIAHLLKSNEIKVSAFVGGIMKNFNSNYLDEEGSEYMVVEADEFDRSFLQLHPEIAVVSSIDADHLDIYKEKYGLEQAFRLFIRNIKTGGRLVMKYGLPLQRPASIQTYTYGQNKEATYRFSHQKEKGEFLYSYSGLDMEIRDLSLKVPGWHNAENALAAAIAGQLCGLKDEEIKKGLESWSGVKRRFDIRIHNKNNIYIDDYAHHPNEIIACLEAVRKMFPGRKITGIFQPHLYSRTRDFMDEFAKSLELLDELYLLDIYPAREKPIEGVDSKKLFNKIKLEKKYLCKKEEMPERIRHKKPGLLLTIGAGDIDRLVEPLEKILKE